MSNVNGFDLMVYERAMSVTILAAMKDSIVRSMPSTQLQTIESGGFPTAGLRIGRGGITAVPIVLFAASSTISSKWLSEQSQEWAARALSDAAVRIAAAMTAAIARRPEGMSVVGIDMSSVSASFQKMSSDAFIISFRAGIALYPPAEQDDIIVSTEQETVDVGVLDVASKLPDEMVEIMGRFQDGIKAMLNDPSIDNAFSALMEEESPEDFFW